MTIEELVEKAHSMAREKGWHPEGEIDADRIGALLALVHSEVSEALDAFRNFGFGVPIGPAGKPEGFAIELADVAIRVADVCGLLKIDLAKAVEDKMAYNATRPHRHGGKLL